MKKLKDKLGQLPLTSFILMIVVGVYLLYTVHILYKNVGTHTGSVRPLYFFMAVFTLIALVFLLIAVFHIVTHRYKKKPETRENTEEIEILPDSLDDGTEDWEDEDSDDSVDISDEVEKLLNEDENDETGDGNRDLDVLQEKEGKRIFSEDEKSGE